MVRRCRQKTHKLWRGRFALVGALAVLCSQGALADDPAWKKAYLLSRAGDAWAHNRFDEAAKLFTSVLQFDPGDEVALLHLGVAARKRGDLNQAIAYFSTGATAHPQAFSLQHELGSALLEAHRPADAVIAFKAAVASIPRDLDAQVNLGDALMAAGQAPVAWEAYSQALSITPTSGWAQRQAGYCAFTIGKAAEAVDLLTRARTTYPKEFSLELVLGHAHARLGNDGAALEAYRRASALAPQNDQGPLFVGTVLEKLKQFTAAQASYEAALRLNQKNESAHIHLGNVFQVMQLPNRARTEYAAALKLSPKSMWALMQLGFLELTAGHGAEAQRLLKQALALSPYNSDLAIALGDAYHLLSKDAEALRQYNSVLAREPGHLAGLVKSADLLRVAGKKDLAMERYTQAVRLHPRSSWAEISLGDALRSEGHAADARPHYEAAFTLDPNSNWARRQLGYNLFELGDDERSRSLLEPLATESSQEKDLFIVLGHLALRREALDEAWVWYERARVLDPKAASVLQFQAEVLRRRKDYPRALRLLADATSLDPALVDAWILLGDVERLSAGARDAVEPRAALERAKAAYAKARTLAPKSPAVLRQAGTLAFELGDEVDAAALLPKAHDAFPDDGELDLLLGHLAAKRNDFAAAKGWYLQAKSAMPTEVRPWVFAARTCVSLAQFDEAETLFIGALQLAPDSGWANLEHGFAQRLRRDWAGAFTSAERATTLEPDNSQAWLFLGRLRQERGQPSAAITAYEKASALVPTSAIADRALASALTGRGTVDDLLRAQRLLERPRRELDAEGYTHAITGYTMVKLSKVSELDLPAPVEPDTRSARRAKWVELGAFELTRAVDLAPTDDALRLSAAVGLFELGLPVKSRQILEPLLAETSSRCPDEEWSPASAQEQVKHEPAPATNPDEVAALERSQLNAEAHLLAGDLATAAPASARLEYRCALRWMPRADAHLRLGASYETWGLMLLAEQHYVAAQAFDSNAAAQATRSLERLRKEAGFPLGPVRLSADTTFTSEAVPGEVQARQAHILGFSAVELQRELLTTPRAFTFGAQATWQRPQWASALRLGLGYHFGLGFNAFLNDQLTFENRRAHFIDAFAEGRRGFEDPRYEMTWRGGYRLSIANATSRAELRHEVAGAARLLRAGWGALEAQASYEFGQFTPTPGVTLADTVAHGATLGIRVNPLFAKWELEGWLGSRVQLIVLEPSTRTLWLYALTLEVRKSWQHLFVGGDLRFGTTSDHLVTPRLDAGASSFLVRGSAGYRWNGYSNVSARAGVQVGLGQSTYDSVLVGLAAEHRFVFAGMHDTETGLSASLAYDARISYALAHVEHLFTATVTLGR